MFTPFKYGLALLALSLALLHITPLALFMFDFMRDASCLQVSSEVEEVVDWENVKVKLSIYYCSRVPIERLIITMGSSNITLEGITRGRLERTVILPLRDMVQGIRGITLTIAHSYSLQIKYGG